jgi:hypothetical protein
MTAAPCVEKKFKKAEKPLDLSTGPCDIKKQMGFV